MNERGARPFRVALAALFGVLLATGVARAQSAGPGPLQSASGPVLRVSGIPDESAEERQRRFAPLGRHLEKALGSRVEYVVAPDYATLVEGAAGGRLDLVWTTAYHYLQTQAQSGGRMRPLVQREEDERFRSVFIARAGSGFAKLEDLRGRDFVFGASTSATGHLMPRYYLMQSGVDPRTDLAKFFFSGAHEATINHVAAGRASAGSLNLATWNRLVVENRVDRSKVEAFYETGRFNDYLWAVRGDIDAPLAERLRATFLALDPARAEEARILELQRASRYIETRDAYYEPIEISARAAGLLK